MSWEQSYSYTVALAIDRFGAAVIFNEPDITISSLCWVVRLGTPAQVAAFKFSSWQRLVLRGIGSGLEFFWPGHCAGARDEDIAVSSRTRQMLS